MTTFVGVDWGSNGWVTAVRRPDGWSATLYPSILGVWHHHRAAAILLVDVPIGLPETGRRTCDRRAKEFLGGQQGRVFWTPPRATLHADTYTAAKSIVEERTDDSMSTQAWGFLPRIEAVDDLFAEIPAAGGRLRESHPEVCFATLNDGDPVAASKTTEEGVDRRLELLDEHDERAKAGYERIVAEQIEEPPAYGRRFSATNQDDLLDAMALALAGRLGTESGRLATIPSDPPVDEVRDVLMEIVYPEI